MESEQVRKAVIAFVGTSTIEDTRRVLEEYRSLLLGEEADQILAELIQEYEDNQPMVQFLIFHREILAQFRHEGIDVVNNELDNYSVSQAVLAFLNARTLSERRQIVIDQQKLLSSESADKAIADLIHQNRRNPQALEDLHFQRNLLARLRTEGIKAVLDVLNDLEVPQAVLTFLNADTWNKRLRILRERHDLLLNKRADEVLADLIQRYQNNPNAVQDLKICRTCLAIFRDEGVDAVFAALDSRGVKVLLDAAVAWDEILAALQEHRDEQAKQNLEDDAAPARDQHSQTHQENLPLFGEETIRSIIEQQDIQLELRELLRQILAMTDLKSMEQRTKLCKQALTLQPYERDPHLWAILQVALGSSLVQSLTGDRRENLEQAISAYRHALTIFTPNVFPHDWAIAQIGLGDAYLQRIEGARVHNMEQALIAFRSTLLVWTRDTEPAEWAMAQNQIGIAYRERIYGNWVDNLEQAIQAFHNALSVYTVDSLPTKWAMVQLNLGTAYRVRIRGERADNLEQAIQTFHSALTFCTSDTQPLEWAKLQVAIGNAYVDRIRGERADNLEQAIQAFHNALTVYTIDSLPTEWAMVQLNLGAAYSARIRGERADNLEQAIQAFHNALTVYTTENMTIRWADAQHNLGVAYADRIKGERADNLEQAIQAFHSALTIFTPDALPRDWAITQNSLGKAYVLRVHGEHSENLEQAIQAFRNALIILTPETVPRECRVAALNLGWLLHGQQRYSEARTTLETAHSAVEALRIDTTRNETKRQFAEDNAALYAHLVHCCLEIGDPTAAFVFAATGKSRGLVDLLATDLVDLTEVGRDNPALTSALLHVHHIQDQIDALLTYRSDRSAADDSLLEDRPGVSYSSIHTSLLRLYAEERTAWEELTYRYPALTATQRVPLLDMEAAQALARTEAATLVEFFHHAGGWEAFVVTPTEINAVPLPGVNDALLLRISQWINQTTSPTGRGRLSYFPLQNWYSALITPWIGQVDPQCPLLLAPHQALHRVPFGAVRNPQNGRYLVEEFQIGFIPSLAGLKVIRDQATRSQLEEQPITLLSVAHSGTPYLSNVLPEAKAVARHFAQVEQIHQIHATPDAVVTASRARPYLATHIACHGRFNEHYPEQSGLMLEGGWLTVRRIITELRLPGAALATLSACETGRPQLHVSDEGVGLVQAMLATGVTTVVASAWPVADSSTRNLFEVFYTHWLGLNESPAEALRQSSAMLREQPESAHPYYWAAFQVYGLAHAVTLFSDPTAAQAAVHGISLVDGEDIAQLEGEVMTERGNIDTLEIFLRDIQVLLDQIGGETAQIRHEVGSDQVLRELAREFGVWATHTAKIRTDADLIDILQVIYARFAADPILGPLLLDPVVPQMRSFTAAVYEQARQEHEYAEHVVPVLSNRLRFCQHILVQLLQKEKDTHEATNVKRNSGSIDVEGDREDTDFG